MILEILDIDSFCRDLPEVTHPKVDENSKIARTGLFSQQIFGPFKSYRCGCVRSYYRGPNSGEKTCPTCKVDITSSEERSKRYAKITLPFPVINPLMYYCLIKAKPKAKKIIDDLMFFRTKYCIFLKNEGGEIDIAAYRDDDEASKEYESRDGFKILNGPEGVAEYARLMIGTWPSETMDFISKNMDKLFINNVVVIPPAFRNFSINSKGKYVLNNLNKYYSELIMRINKIKQLPFTVDKNSQLFRIQFCTVQKYVFNITNFVLLDKLGKKKGLIRQNILGKRVDFSGRGVIVSDPTLSLKECSVPYKMVLEMYKPVLTSYLVNRRMFKKYNDANTAIEDSLKNGDKRFLEVLNEFVKNKIVIINRQPSLHRMAMFAFFVKVNPDNVIKIHPLICNPLNADFDGDQMAVYAFFDKGIVGEIIEKVGVWNNILSPANGSNVLIPSRDIVLGIYNITK